MSSSHLQDQGPPVFEAVSPMSYSNKVEYQHRGTEKPKFSRDSHSGHEDVSYDLDALIDVVAYLLERRRRRLALAEADGAK